MVPSQKREEKRITRVFKCTKDNHHASALSFYSLILIKSKRYLATEKVMQGLWSDKRKDTNLSSGKLCLFYKRGLIKAPCILTKFTTKQNGGDQFWFPTII